MSRVGRGLGIWPGVALMAGALLLLSGCTGVGSPANPSSPAVPSPGAIVPPSPTQSPSLSDLAASVPASKGKAFPVLGVEIRGETVSIENGQRLSLGDGLFVEVFAVPFPPTPETDVHLFLARGESPLKEAQVRVTYDMIDMDHGALDKRIGREVEAGHYAAPLDLFMWGDWVADITFSHPQWGVTFRVLLGVYPWKGNR